MMAVDRQMQGRKSHIYKIHYMLISAVSQFFNEYEKLHVVNIKGFYAIYNYSGIYITR